MEGGAVAQQDLRARNLKLADFDSATGGLDTGVNRGVHDGPCGSGLGQDRLKWMRDCRGSTAEWGPKQEGPP